MPRPRLVGISVVRDESDIIEAFVRANLALLDRLVILDDGSGDTTPAILARLAAEGLPVEVAARPAMPWFDHSALMTGLLRDVAARLQPDFVFPLDADEMIRVESRERLDSLLAAAPPDRPIRVRWLSYVPTPEDAAAEPDALRRLVRRYAREASDAHKYKIVVPDALARDPAIVVEGGQHGLARGPAAPWTPLPAHDLPELRLAHFPIRSADQALAKILCYELVRQTYMPDSSGPTIDHFKWIEPAFRVSAAQLTRFADAYARPLAPDRVVDPYPVPYPALRYGEMIDVNVVARLVAVARRIGRGTVARGAVEALRRENAELRDTLEEIRSSRLWRAGAPLRLVGRWLGRGRRGP